MTVTKKRVRCFKGTDGKCVQCGVPLQSGHIRTCKAGTKPQQCNEGYKRAPRLNLNPKPPAERNAKAREAQEKYLGDYTKQLLESVGISKKRYRAIKKRLGFAPTCNCDSRQQWLNEADKIARELSRSAADRLLGWAKRVTGATPPPGQ